MTNKFIIGRMIDTGSIIHQLDPRAKMIVMFIYVFIVAMTNTWELAVFVTGLSLVIIHLTQIPVHVYFRAMLPLKYLILFMFLYFLLLTHEGTPILTIYKIQLYDLSVFHAFFTVWRMIALITFTAILTFTTSPAKLTLAIEDICFGLRWFHLSPERLTLMLTTALRFIPTIFDEAMKITKAQAARGLDLNELSWMGKGKMLVSLLVPMTMGAFRRADDLLYSMESRNYQLGRPRTRFYTFNWKLGDTLFMCPFIILAALSIFY